MISHLGDIMCHMCVWMSVQVLGDKKQRLDLVDSESSCNPVHFCKQNTDIYFPKVRRLCIVRKKYIA